MYKLLIASLLIFFCAVVLSAQTSPTRQGAETAKTVTPKTSEKARPAAGSTTRAASRSNLTPANSGTTEKSGTRVSATAPAARNTTKSTARTIPGNNAMPAAPVIAEAAPQIRWMSIEEAMERSKTDKRKVFIDVYTEWCGWCKRMDQTTFTNRDVVKYINDHYYPVRFDAEQDKEIVYHDKTYRFKRNGNRGYHELAAEWLGNRLSYPTVVFLDENLNVIQPLAGYLDPLKLQAILNYFGTDSHKTTPWETYEKKFGQR